VGLILDRLRIPVLPLVLALILAPIMEASLRQTISMGGGSLAILAGRPIALVLLGAGVVVMAVMLVARSRSARARLYLSATEA
jgi:putative tricarboxylic transport membrane protein